MTQIRHYGATTAFLFEQKNPMEIKVNKLSERAYRKKIFTSACMCIISWLQTVKYYLSDQANMKITIVSSMYSGIFILELILTMENYRHRHSIKNFFNEIVRFEMRHNCKPAADYYFNFRNCCLCFGYGSNQLYFDFWQPRHGSHLPQR